MNGMGVGVCLYILKKNTVYCICTHTYTRAQSTRTRKDAWQEQEQKQKGRLSLLRRDGLEKEHDCTVSMRRLNPTRTQRVFGEVPFHQIAAYELVMRELQSTVCCVSKAYTTSSAIADG